MKPITILSGEPVTPIGRQTPAFRTPVDINRCFVCNVPIQSWQVSCLAHSPDWTVARGVK